MLGTLAIWALAFIFLAYAIPHLVVAWFYKTKNLKKAYNAEWALVTGASSGEARSGLERRARPAPPPPLPLPPTDCPASLLAGQHRAIPSCYLITTRHRQVDRTQAGGAGPERGAGGAGR